MFTTQELVDILFNVPPCPDEPQPDRACRWCEAQAIAQHINTQLAARGADRARMGCPRCHGPQAPLADDNPPVFRCIICGTGWWDEPCDSPS